jgi:hypothetical protein
MMWCIKMAITSGKPEVPKYIIFSIEQSGVWRVERGLLDAPY